MLLYYIEKTFFSQYSKLYFVLLGQSDIAIYDVFSGTRRWQILSNIRLNNIAHGPCVVVHNYTKLNVIITEFVVSVCTSK